MNKKETRLDSQVSEGMIAKIIKGSGNWRNTCYDMLKHSDSWKH